MKNALYAGVNAAALTSFNDDLSVNYEKTVAHCHYLLNNGCNSLAVLGTTSETQSLSLSEREALLEQLVESGISPQKMLPGTGACDIPSVVNMSRHAARLGCPGVLVLPPFYYKNPSEDGLFDFYSTLADKLGGEVKLYFYHFPQQTSVPLTLRLIERLLHRYPDVFQGIKDSSADYDNTLALINNFSSQGFEVYSGADATFAQVMKAGAAGCITATTNIASPLTAFIYKNYHNADGLEAQATLAHLRKIVAMGDTIPAVKALLAYKSNDPGWENIRPPLRTLSADVQRDLIAAYRPLFAQ